MKPNQLLGISGFLLAIAVATGAFGAHALEKVLTPERLETWNTAVLYHFLNSLGLVGVAVVSRIWKVNLKLASGLILGGILIFSGSLYTLCLTDTAWLGMITPLGGVSFIVGWTGFGIRMFRHTETENS